MLRLPPPNQFPTGHLPLTHDFQYVGEEMPYKDRIALGHRRAKAIAKAHGDSFVG